MNVGPHHRLPIAEILKEGLPEAEFDRIFAERHEEIEALLEESRQAKAEGRYAPLEPLHEFLVRARERLKASQ
jgi:hypothetical protein